METRRDLPHDPDNPNHAVGVDGIPHGEDNQDEERLAVLRSQRAPDQLHSDEHDGSDEG